METDIKGNLLIWYRREILEASDKHLLILRVSLLTKITETWMQKSISAHMEKISNHIKT